MRNAATIERGTFTVAVSLCLVVLTAGASQGAGRWSGGVRDGGAGAGGVDLGEPDLDRRAVYEDGECRHRSCPPPCG
jgi:hypothetical protein